MTAWRALLAALALLAAPTTLAAADTDEVSVLGSWTFEAKTRDGCEFGGVAYLTAGEDAEIHACELTARQACPAITYVVRQSCTARRSGEQLIIRSAVEEFLEGEPTAGYWPDNFILTIKSESRMIGALLSHGSYAAEFRRTQEGVS